MSPLESAESGRGVYVEKPKSNIFTVMLLMSLLAILVAIVVLCLEMNSYEWDIKAPSGAMNQAVPREASSIAWQPPEAAAWRPASTTWSL